MTIGKWIASRGGDAAVARLLGGGVTRQRVYAWRTGRCKPNGQMTVRIIMLSNGMVTFGGRK